MKLNKNIRKTPQGVTLIELSVVIAVILTLLSVLFVGATYYKEAADKAACVINLNAIAKAASAYSNIENADATWTVLTATGGPLAASTPECPEADADSDAYSLTGTGATEYTATCNVDSTHNENNQ